MSLGEFLLTYFSLNFVFIVVTAYTIIAGKILERWRNPTTPILFIATAVAIFLVFGLAYETAGYLGMFIFVLLMSRKQLGLGERLFGKISEGSVFSVAYLACLFLLSLAAAYWRLNSVKDGVLVGAVHFVYAILAIYSNKLEENT